MPSDWFAPHPSYATGVEATAAASEFATLVDTFHQHGLRVTIDAVFNHNAETEALGIRSLAALDPEGYFRRWDDGSQADGAGCGNEFASESHFGRQLIRDACRYWVERYGVDGFRFDLMGLVDQQTLDCVRADLDEVDPSLMLYGEPWAAGPSPRPVLGKGTQRGRRIAVFNDTFRDELRGNLFDTHAPGALTTGDAHAAERILYGGIGEDGQGFADTPQEVIQYAECHDDLTLVDRLIASDPGANEEAALERSALAALLLMFAPGMPFIHSGQEFGRSKNGIANTYNKGDDANNIRWVNKRINHRLFRHYRRAIALRQFHPMLRPRTALDTIEHRSSLAHHIRNPIPRGVFGVVITDWSDRDRWSRCMLCVNATDSQVSITPLENDWRSASKDGVLLDQDAPSFGDSLSETVAIKPRGFLLAYTLKPDANATPSS